MAKLLLKSGRTIASSYAEEKIIKIATLEDYAPFCILNGFFLYFLRQ